MKINLSKQVIDKAQKEGKRCSLWDTQITGLYVEVRDNGKASYLLRYTSPEHGKQSVTIGATNIIKLDDARSKARELLSQVYLGNDPAQRKQQLRTALTLDEVVDKHYMPHIKAHKKSWDCDDSLLRNHILPVLGKLKINAIQTEDITRLHLAASAKGLAPATCNRIVVLLRFLFNLAIKQWKIAGIKENPACAVKQFKVDNQQQTFLSPEQIQRLLEETNNCKQNPQLSFIIALLALTGVRRSNVLKAKWCEFDETNQTWLIPVTKSGKPQTIQLSSEVLQMLQVLPSRGHSEHLFPNPHTGKPYCSIFTSWNTARKRAGLANVRIHDLRHTFASLLINAGHSLYVVQKALGHYSPTVTMRYAHLADETLKQANNAVGHLVKAGIARVLQPHI